MYITKTTYLTSNRRVLDNSVIDAFSSTVRPSIPLGRRLPKIVFTDDRSKRRRSRRDAN